MEIDLKVVFQDLNFHLKDDQKGPLECIRLLDLLNRNLTEEQVDSSLIDVYLIYIFHTSDGLLQFIETSVKNKPFKKASAKAVEILFTTINNFPAKVPERDILSIYTLSIKIVNSDTDSSVKLKLFELLQLCVEKYDGCTEDRHAKSVYEALLKAILHALMQKHTDTVKGKEMAFLGWYAKKYPYYVTDPKKIKQILWMNFEKQIAQPKKISQYILGGFFDGFRYFLESFPLDVESNDGKKISATLYKALKTLVVTKERLKLGNRAALLFLANNIDLFKEKLLEEYEFWHNKLLVWLTFGVEDKKVGVTVLKAFFQAVAQVLDEKEGDAFGVVVKHFNNYCTNVLETKETSNSERHLAIFCLRQFSSPSHKHLTPDDVTALFLAIMRNFEETYILNYDSESEESEYLPDYVQTVANFMKFKKFSTSELFCLQRAVINMVKSFHRLPILHVGLVVDSFVMTLFYMKESRHFDVFLENVVYQGVVWTCSHQHTTNEAYAEETNQNIVTVRNYFPLWNGILKVSSNTKLHLEDRKYLLERIVKELVKTVLVLINKLNVSVRLKEENDVVTDLEQAYRVDQSDDYAIFLNVVDFYREMFDNIEPKVFRNCICRLIGHFVDKCLKYPLVSGFYKLLSYALRIAKKSELFSTDTVDVRNCQETLHAFLAILLNKMADFKDELSISCLQVLLNTPIVIVEGMLELCVVPFVNIFEMGRSYLPLARMGLDTLELWQEHMDPAVLDPVLMRIIPSLDSFLRSKSLRGFAQSTVETRKTRRAMKKRKVLVELEPELVRLQRRILCFVGKQNLRNLRAYIFSERAGARNLICGQESHLKVTLPYEDVQVDIYLDTFVPRIIDLALHCSDRKTRITACELLQAAVMVLLGKARPMNQSGLLELNNMLKTIAMPLLLLSSDVDQVVQQIFAPLFLQLVHWYTSPTQQRGAHSAILIDAMMDGITHPTNSSLRDFSGKCVKEFVTWTIKQSDEQTLARDPVNIKILLKNMRFFSTHPDGAKKLGAALIFNNIYREIREEEAMISIFWLEILHIFVQSLNAVSALEESNTVVQIRRSLKNVQRVFVEKPSIFRKADAKRRVPNELNEGLLKDVAVWLLKQTASRSRHCREASMELFINIAPLACERKTKLQTFVQENLGSSLTELYSNSLLEFDKLKERHCENIDTLLKWMRCLLCVIDGYNFVAKNNLGDIAFENSALFRQIQFFLEHLQTVEIAEALNMIARKTWTFTTIDKDHFGLLKTSCVLSIFNFFNTVLSNGVLLEKSASIWTKGFWLLLSNAVFKPRAFGLNDVLHPGYEEQLVVLINNVSRKLSPTNLTELNRILISVIVSHAETDIDLRKNVGLSQRSVLRGMIFLRGTHLNKFLQIENYSSGLIQKLLSSFHRKADGNVIFVSDLQDTTFSYINSLLEFALSNESEFGLLMEQLHSEFIVQSMEYTKEKSFGVYFLDTFGETVFPVILEHFDRFLTVSLAKDNLKTTIEYVVLVLNHWVKQKPVRVQGRDIASILDQHWKRFEAYFETDRDTMNTGLEYLKLLVQVDDLHSVQVQEWLVQCLLKSDGSNDLEIFHLLVLIATQENDNSLNFKPVLQTLTERITLEDPAKINKMLSYLPLVRSTTIFQFIVNVYLKTSPTTDISSLLTKFIANRDRHFQKSVMEIVYERSCDAETAFDSRYKMATKFIPPLFHGCDINIFENFFVRHIREILEVLREPDSETSIPYFVLTEILFLRVLIGSKERETCAITKAAGVPKLLRELLAPALKVFEMPVGESSLSRKHKCHAYNALASMVSNSLKLNDFYNKLFSREVNNQDVLWHGIVDTSATYEFPVDFDTIPMQRKVLVNIRDELKRSRRADGLSKSKSLKYIESQRLFASSLSEDVTNFDFTNSVLRENAEGKMQKGDEGVERTVLQLDGTEINEHECMGTVCGMIQHIFDTGINDLPRADEEDIELPKWMDGIRTTLLNEKTHNNVKIFLVKVIDNMMHIFTPYSKWFLEPLMLFVTNKCAGEGINYFVTDVIVILSKWASTLTILSEKEAETASDLLKFLIENLKRERIDIFKYNLDITKMIVEAWKNHLAVPTSTILGVLSSDDTSEIGVNVTSILLVNGLNCWEEGREMAFLELLLSKMKSAKKEVFRPAAETVGLMLHILNGDQFTLTVDVGLKRVNQEYEKYVLCLEGVSRHFPQIVNSYHVSRLISPLNQVPDAQKVVHLRIICKRVELSLDILEEINDFKIVDWDRLLESASLEIQIVALEIIKKCITVFVTYENFRDIGKTLSRNVANANALYRSCLYDVCIEVYNLKRDDSGAYREMLILGLMDTDADNNEKIMNFWSENTSIPSTVVLRFPFLLSEMYKTKIEGQFLGFVTFFLMALATRSEHYDSELFQHPLEDCDFEEYQLQTDWRLQHPSVVPMFAETLRTFDGSAPAEESSGFRLRQTQDTLEFAQTQSLHEQQLSKFTGLSSSLAVSFDDGIKNPNTMILSQKYRIPRRRFLKDKAKISISSAHHEVKKQVKKVQQRIDSAIEKEKKVTIYRSYRKGDFPDIQITLSSVLKPLQILALHDNEISKTLFTEIFKGLVDKAGDNRLFLDTITKAIRSIFTSSTQYHPNLIGALFDILLRHKDRIQFDAQTVAFVAQESGLVSVGTLLLEEYVCACDSLPSSSKMGVGQQDKEAVYWVKIAELYRELEEWDMVRTIFVEKMNCKEDVQRAIKFESESKFRDAQYLYKRLIETDLSQERKDFYYDSYFRCFASLGEWEELPKVINSVVEGENPWHQLWDNGWQQQKLLPWYIKSQVRNTLFTQEWNPDFLKDINDCLSDPDKNEYLRGHFSEEICAMWLCQKDVVTANVYLKSCMRSFLDEWQLLNPMFQSLRFHKLLQLQNVIETEDFLNIYDNLLDDPEVSLRKYAQRLQKSSTDVLPTVMLNETRLLYRTQFINLLLEKISGIEGVDFRDVAKELQLTKIRMDIDLINSAVGFGNYYMARKYFKKYLGKVNAKLQVAYGNIACLKARISESAQVEVKWSLEGIALLESVAASSQDQMILLSCSMKLFDVFSNLSSTLSSNPEIFEQCKPNLEDKLGRVISTTSDIQTYAWKQLKATIDKSQDDSMECDNYEDRSKFKEISEAYVKLAHFLRDRAEDDDEVQGDMILFVLRAMKMNNSEARQLFPCVLKQSEIGGKYKDMFVEETDKIPTWMFLGWIPQLLSSVDSSKISAVSKMIMRIAETYPQSIMYPYRLSRMNYDFSNASVKLLTNRLDDLLLKDEMINKFLQALSFVSVPVVSLRYYISKMMMTDNLAAAKTVQESVKKDFFSQKHGSNTESMHGNMYKQIEPFNREFSKTLGTSLAKMKENLKHFDGQLSAILSNKKTKYSQLLKEYCPWLANFSADKQNMELEIPGQYDGRKMPLTQHHVKISGFCPTVSVMKSLRKPIKVTMLGADTKEYPFLVKFGEDIRQDQRIEQLFGLMNDIFRSDATCSNNGLDILTYQVIPLTSSLGIIQWINDTEPLSEFMKKSLKSEKAKENFGSNTLGDKYSRWLCNGKDFIQIYGKSAVKYNRNKVVPFYNSLVNEIPLDILKTSFRMLSIDTENYIAMRANFIKTHATMCVGQWLLGIGDRHLNNSLVCLGSGKLLGIDFGHAFGTATQILPVPELLPFRLTPHLLNLMEPLKERGHLRHCMIASLRALRSRSAPLLATMRVFVEEPSLDWLEHARRFEGGGADEVEGRRWYPESKVGQCRRKLAGVGSAAILVEDLVAGTRVPEYTEAFVKLVLGEREHDLRARTADDNDFLSVEEQVDCLIDHATDPNLLGRMYAGWMPWI
ncbi:unnamed protein product [Phaedon cochleariae]|uniref:non-specific serine/threonine protein kinase n=1 Tax=Phaedon cochleariae TaxID=80249 RepID=A0A9P0DNI4_PHACE|nr:unnamed protein product [Phaedon cochleariae]